MAYKLPGPSYDMKVDQPFASNSEFQKGFQQLNKLPFASDDWHRCYLRLQARVPWSKNRIESEGEAEPTSASEDQAQVKEGQAGETKHDVADEGYRDPTHCDDCNDNLVAPRFCMPCSVTRAKAVKAKLSSWRHDLSDKPVFRYKHELLGRIVALEERVAALEADKSAPEPEPEKSQSPLETRSAKEKARDADKATDDKYVQTAPLQQKESANADGIERCHRIVSILLGPSAAAGILRTSDRLFDLEQCLLQLQSRFTPVSGRLALDAAVTGSVFGYPNMPQMTMYTRQSTTSMMPAAGLFQNVSHMLTRRFPSTSSHIDQSTTRVATRPGVAQPGLGQSMSFMQPTSSARMSFAEAHRAHATADAQHGGRVAPSVTTAASKTTADSRPVVSSSSNSTRKPGRGKRSPDKRDSTLSDTPDKRSPDKSDKQGPSQDDGPSPGGRRSSRVAQPSVKALERIANEPDTPSKRSKKA
eukprot:TRINITY_DN10897_c0_g1_i10.p1 TRINITY_DN10897_c0_g1~~TRINITY_DN10897_c0_g1_i10.p1  ORF type:complete len:473 (+),score=65.32 TRINITY_DN10897_c0_g1_i10:24-1442(+)